MIRIGSWATRVGAVSALGGAVALAFALSAACGGSDFSSDAGSGISADQACADSANAQCAKLQTCTPGTLEPTYGTLAACQTRLKEACVKQLAAPSAGGTPTKTEACAQAYAAYACSDYRNKTNTPLACAQVTGSLANGAPCVFAAQCTTGFCAIVPGKACGVCATPPRAGDACSQLTSCGQTLDCTIDTQECVPFAAEGAPCGAGVPCGAGLSCVTPAGAAATCQTAGAQVGVACDGSLKNAPGCDALLGLYCNGLTRQCAATTFAAAGQACGYDKTTGSNVACASGACAGSDATTATLGLCVGRAADGAACSVPDGGASAPSTGCEPPVRCIATAAASAAGTCQLTNAAACE